MSLSCYSVEYPLARHLKQVHPKFDATSKISKEAAWKLLAQNTGQPEPAV